MNKVIKCLLLIGLCLFLSKGLYASNAALVLAVNAQDQIVIAGDILPPPN